MLSSKTGATKTIEFAHTVTSDFFPQIGLPDNGKELNEEPMVAVELRLTCTKDSYQNQPYTPLNTVRQESNLTWYEACGAITH